MSGITQGAEALLDATVNEVVNAYPETLPVFQRYGIDACCGGAHAVGEAARRHRVDAVLLASELRGAIGI